MTINDELIDRLSNLAKLNFEEEGKQAIKQDLEKILNFFQTISELDTDQVEPLVYMNQEVNIARKDEVKVLINKEEGLKNAPKADENFFLVPKMISK